MMTRTQILLPPDLLQTARLYAASNNLSLSELIRRSVIAKIKPQKKISVYEAFKRLAIKNRDLKKLPKDFATNDKYLYIYP